MTMGSEQERWSGLHPVLAARLQKVLNAMMQSGHPMFITQGLRSDAEQIRLYAIGRTVKGLKVTNADGVTHRSKHQAQSDGLSHAADCAFVGPEPFADEHPWQLFGAIAQDCGLIWGGNWKHMADRPHVELPVDHSVNL